MDDNDYVLAFDHFYTTNHIQILKSLLPFIEGKHARLLPVLIKYMELKYTLALTNNYGNSIYNNGIFASDNKEQNEKKTGEISENIERIYHAVHRYLAPDEEKQLSQMMSAMQTMKSMREMQQMMEMLQSLNPDSDKDGAFGNLGNLAGLGNLGNMDIDINELMQMLNQDQTEKP